MRLIVAFLENEAAATAVEYAVMLALILAVVITTISSFGQQTDGMWGRVRSEMEENGF